MPALTFTGSASFREAKPAELMVLDAARTGAATLGKIDGGLHCARPGSVARRRPAALIAQNDGALPIF
jgi:hypothetical protein